MDDYELAVMSEQLRREQWDRFREFAGESSRGMIDESERMRAEFLRHVQSMLTSDDDRERMISADWVRKNAADVAYVSAVVRAMYRRFVTVDCPPIAIPVDG